VWGTAAPIPGVAALNTAGEAGISSISCASAGNCTVGGFYTGRSLLSKAFLATELGDKWHSAFEVPGLAGLGSVGDAAVGSVSCPSVGNCAAVGSYQTNAVGGLAAFITTQVKGRWGNAFNAPGLAALATGGFASAVSVSCPSAGNCSAGGFYTTMSGPEGPEEAFVVSERNGHWGHAIEVPGVGRLNLGNDASIAAVSCPSAGNCVASGTYADFAGNNQIFLGRQRNGTWHNAIELPGAEALDAGNDSGISALSCPSAGNCGLGGFYIDSKGRREALVAIEQNGTWSNAIEVPGTGALNAGGFALIFSVSCAAAGTCTVGGEYTDRTGRKGQFTHNQAFVASERGGKWHSALKVAGTDVPGDDAKVFTVSCPAADACTAGGVYKSGLRSGEAFLVTEKNGRWGRAFKVPGTAALNTGGDAEVDVVSCTSGEECTAAGFYTGHAGHREPYAITKT
jgi:hypothetical protein